MRQRTTLGVLSPFLGGFYFGGLLTGIQRAAHQQGAQVLAIQTLGEHARSDNPGAAQQGRTKNDRDARTSQPVIDHPFASELVDGWIVVVDESSVNYLRKNTSPGTPLVTISMYIPDLNCPAVLPDNRGGTAAAVRHLLEHGHTRIAFVGNLTQDDIRQRYEGYQAALREHGIEPAPELLYTTEDNLEVAGRNTASRIVEQGVNFTALVAGTDLNAIGVMAVLQEAGYRFPDDIALIGFDDMDRAQHTNPPLTSVRPRFDALGATAAQLLQARISGEAIAPGPRYVATALIQRRSCGCSVAKSFAGANGELAQQTLDWRARLLRQLAQLAVYPLVLDQQADPAQVWPGAQTMLQALDTIATGGEGPGSSEIARAWGQVFDMTSDLEVFQAMIGLIDSAGWQLLPPDPARAARERHQACIEQLRLEMIRARLATETMRSTYLANIIESNYEISLTLLGAADGSAKNLDWLWRTPLRWGCLGLWANPNKMSELVVAGAHSRNDERAPALGTRYPPQIFPPVEYVPPLTGAADSDILMLIPLRTSTHDWGVLALVGPIDTKLSSGNDPMSHWAALLSAALEREDLLASLADQQNTLRQAYERERALANTVRELGSPVIPLLPGVLLVPLVGAIDSERAQQFIEELLHGVSSHNASVVLLDITGVPLVDTQIANSLIQATRAATLLGARVILVGVRPEIAQSIVGLGIELRHMATQPTLAAALESLQWGREGNGPLAIPKSGTRG